MIGYWSVGANKVRKYFDEVKGATVLANEVNWRVRMRLFTGEVVWCKGSLLPSGCARCSYQYKQYRVHPIQLLHSESQSFPGMQAGMDQKVRRCRPVGFMTMSQLSERQDSFERRKTFI